MDDKRTHDLRRRERMERIRARARQAMIERELAGRETRALMDGARARGETCRHGFLAEREICPFCFPTPINVVPF